jgi:hypothetical protein
MHSLKRGSSPYKRAIGVTPLKNLKLIGKIATFFSAVSFIFVILSLLITYFLLQVASPTAPTNYVALYILTTILPYLFIAVLSLVIAVISWGFGKESLETEAPPPVQLPQGNA